jgi:hypothetical protein
MRTKNLLHHLWPQIFATTLRRYTNWTGIAILRRKLSVHVTEPTKAIRVIEDDVFVLGHQSAYSRKCDAVSTFPFLNRYTFRVTDKGAVRQRHPLGLPAAGLRFASIPC